MPIASLCDGTHTKPDLSFSQGRLKRRESASFFVCFGGFVNRWYFGPMPMHHKLDYVEFASADLDKSKVFFQRAFGWDFEDFGPDYTAFSGAGLAGGFFRADQASRTSTGAALLVFYSEDIAASLRRVRDCGAKIIKPIFAFPGGHRFHFIEPMGNEFAVWSDQ